MLNALCFAALSAALSADPAFHGELIFTPNDKHNHGSSIVQAPNGDLLACWFHGTGERKNDDVLVQGARKRKGSDTWSEPFLMADTPNLPDCNPVLFVDPRGTLWLFWIAVMDNEWGGSLLKYRTSTSYTKDGPPEWDWQDVIHTRPLNIETKFPEILAQTREKYADYLAKDTGLKNDLEALEGQLTNKRTIRLGWMTRLHPIMLSDGSMMLGLYSDVWNCSLAAFTKDWGQTWEFSEPIANADLGNIQPAFVVRKDGGIMCFMRDNGPPKLIRAAESMDNGRTWPKVWNLDIPNPGSSVECIALESGTWLLICNDQLDGRHVLTAYLSEDEGKTWPISRRIEDYKKDEASASYPSLMQLKGGDIHLTYSFKIEAERTSSIKHVTFNEEWVRAGK